MGTVNYASEPGETVWIITGGVNCPLAVQEGIVVQVFIKVVAPHHIGSPTIEPTVTYDVRIGSDIGTTMIADTDIFGDSVSIGSPPDNGKAAAIVEYNNRLDI